jgi:hypothetical protein
MLVKRPLVNLVSAVRRLASADLLHASLWRPRRLAMLAVALRVSHTFWHAVRRSMARLSHLTAWLWLKWRQSAKVWQLGLIGLMFGLAFSTHVLVLLYLPALVWLLIVQRTKLSVRGWAFLLGDVGDDTAVVLWHAPSHAMGSCAAHALFTTRLQQPIPALLQQTARPMPLCTGINCRLGVDTCCDWWLLVRLPVARVFGSYVPCPALFAFQLVGIGSSSSCRATWR